MKKCRKYKAAKCITLECLYSRPVRSACVLCLSNLLHYQWSLQCLMDETFRTLKLLGELQSKYIELNLNRGKVPIIVDFPLVGWLVVIKSMALVSAKCVVVLVRYKLIFSLNGENTNE